DGEAALVDGVVDLRGRVRREADDDREDVPAERVVDAGVAVLVDVGGLGAHGRLAEILRVLARYLAVEVVPEVLPRRGGWIAFSIRVAEEELVDGERRARTVAGFRGAGIRHRLARLRRAARARAGSRAAGAGGRR